MLVPTAFTSKNIILLIIKVKKKVIKDNQTILSKRKKKDLMMLPVKEKKVMGKVVEVNKNKKIVTLVEVQDKRVVKTVKIQVGNHLTDLTVKTLQKVEVEALILGLMSKSSKIWKMVQVST